jgi:RNAse (barnase) inhibitor barstar
MSDETKSEFWRRHLIGVENPLVHFVAPNCLDLKIIQEAGSELAFALFSIDAQHLHSVPALMDAFAEAMNFPTYFGRNWNAVFDLTRDLSWNQAEGYVLVLLNADPLLHLESHAFSSLIRVIEATVRDWRDERGECSERTGPIPFHVVFSGTDDFREALLRESKEPLCIHEADLSIRVVRTPGGVGEGEAFRDSQRLLQSGADPELILLFLRDRGYGQQDSIYAIAGLIDESIPKAKALVDHSKAWSADLYEQDERLRDWARKTLRDLGFS